MNLFPRLLEDKVWYYGDERLWKTQEGKNFAKMLLEKFPTSIEEIYLPESSLDNTEIDFPILRSQPTLTAKIVKPSERVEKKEVDVDNRSSFREAEKEDNICMICLDNKADTMVLPCNHIVVCKVCSNNLQKTPDNKICVQCRRPISEVMWDGGNELKV